MMGKVTRFLNQHGLVVLAHSLMVLLIVIVSNLQPSIILFAVSSVVPIYLNHFVLIPRLLNERKLWKYVANVLLMLVVYYFFFYTVMRAFFYVGNDLGMKNHKPEHFWDQLLLGMTMFVTVLLVIFGLVTSIIRLIHDSMSVAEMRERLSSIQGEKMAAELTGLKSQINPHFFFNSLNSIYALSLDASPETPSYILKLSGLMRYVLYECNQPFVALSKEIEFLRSYIDLQRIRLNEKYTVEFVVEVEQEEQPIAPLLFLPLIENCFKHGLGAVSSSSIKILLKADAEQVYLRTENPYTPSMLNKPNREGGHIGLANVEKRLKLIYPDRHQMSYKSEGYIFTSEITIKP
ncbi:sensor histidine kinase [Alistipes sp. ZOR0009]|uniref:sensor histidine kinase n=1 Tax=Alistipes sp. ZOR0009 TaxID=1339253 RepID=UPI0009DD647D|nr:histidine kinase [Alistipes sp. ZOR0009]